MTEQKDMHPLTLGRKLMVQQERDKKKRKVETLLKFEEAADQGIPISFWGTIVCSVIGSFVGVIMFCVARDSVADVSTVFSFLVLIGAIGTIFCVLYPTFALGKRTKLEDEISILKQKLKSFDVKADEAS